jgi:F-type H+-transporting ATPase subunit b
MAEAPHAAEAVHGGEAAAHGAEGGGSAFPPFDASLFASQLVWFALTFAALYWIMSRVVLPKVASVKAHRAGTLSADREGAAAKTLAAEQAKAAMEKAIAKARADARKLIDDMRAKTKASLDEEQAQAEAKLAERAQAAESRINTARNKALAEVDGLAAALGRQIADKLAPLAVEAPPAQPRRMAEGETR